MQLNGKVALIVGGAGGIGAATALMFAEAGAAVAVTHRPGKDAAEVLAKLPGTNHAAFPLDIVDAASIAALKAGITETYGRLDVLVNTAGFTKAIPHHDLDALDDALIDQMFAVNWRGQFAVIRAFAPMLKASGDGLIVSISSIAGTNGAGSSIVYGAVKAATDVMTKSLARALAPEIRVLAVAPGAVATGFVPGRGAEFNAKTAATTPLKRVATAEDVASAVLACATHLPYSTGNIIVVDGGRGL